MQHHSATETRVCKVCFFSFVISTNGRDLDVEDKIDVHGATFGLTFVRNESWLYSLAACFIDHVHHGWLFLFGTFLDLVLKLQGLAF